MQLQQISRNAYRILGLPSDANWNEISQRASALRSAARAGIRQRSPWNLEWYGPLEQDERSISDALGRLSSPDQRLSEKLFWISQSELFVEFIVASGLRDSIQSLIESEVPESTHDAAVLALVSCISADPSVRDAERWSEMLELWRSTLTSDEFWESFYNDEYSGQFEPSANKEDCDRLREATLSLALEPVAELIREAISEGEFGTARRALELIRNSVLPPIVMSPFEEAVLGPSENSFAQRCQDITKACWGAVKTDDASAMANQKPCRLASVRWQQEVKPRFHEFVATAGPESAAGVRVAEEYAEFLIGLANAHTWGNQWVQAEELLDEALQYLPAEGAVRERVQGTRQEVVGAAARQRREEEAKKGAASETAIKGFVDLCESITRKLGNLTENEGINLSTEEKQTRNAYAEYKQQASPWLAIITSTHSGDSDVCKRAQISAATCLRRIGAEFYFCGELNQAKLVFSEALALAFDDKELETSLSNWLTNISLKSQATNQPDERSNAGGSQLSPDRKLRQRVVNAVAASVLVLLAIGGLRKSGLSERGVDSAQVTENAVGSQPESNREHDNVSPRTPVQFQQNPAPGPSLERGQQRKIKVSYEAVVPVSNQGSSTVDNESERLTPVDLKEPFSLLTGTNLLDPNGTGGLGELTVSNYSPDDAVVKLKTDIASVVRRLVYIRANDSFKIFNVPPGNYLLQFTKGQDWDTEVHAFRRNQTFGQFGKILDFTEERKDGRSIEYSTFRITLHEVPNGNVRRQAISASDFAEGLNKQMATGTQ